MNKKMQLLSASLFAVAPMQQTQADGYCYISTGFPVTVGDSRPFAYDRIRLEPRPGLPMSVVVDDRGHTGRITAPANAEYGNNIRFIGQPSHMLGGNAPSISIPRATWRSVQRIETFDSTTVITAPELNCTNQAHDFGIVEYGRPEWLRPISYTVDTLRYQACLEMDAQTQCFYVKSGSIVGSISYFMGNGIFQDSLENR